MATLDEVRNKVRRKVFDYDAPQILIDEYYNDAIEFALGKLNNDFNETYADVPSVSTNHLFLLVKLAAIEVCFLRAARLANADDAGEGTGDITSISVPDLTVSEDGEGEAESGAAFWMEYANTLQEEYDGEVANSGPGVMGDIAQGHIHIQSLTNGGIARRKLDPGPDSIAASVTVIGSDVLVEWPIAYYDYFQRYEVTRGQQSNLSDGEVVYQEGDNQVHEWTDEDRPAGTWYYGVKVVNMNDLESAFGTIAPAVVT